MVLKVCGYDCVGHEPVKSWKNNKAKSKFCFLFSLFHYCFNEFPIFTSVVRKIAFKKTYFLFKTI